MAKENKTQTPEELADDIFTELIADPETDRLITRKEFDKKYPEEEIKKSLLDDLKTKFKAKMKDLTYGPRERLQDRMLELMIEEMKKSEREKRKESKAMGGSMLSRQNYDEGSEALGRKALESYISSFDMDIVIEGAQIKEKIPRDEQTPSQEETVKEFEQWKKFNDALDDLNSKNLTEEKAMGGRINYQEGGSLMVPPEMEEASPEPMGVDVPVDTYPNIPPEEMAEAEASQLPDEEMEDKYMDFVVNESLDNEEQSYLMNALEADPMLSQIFDKVITTASEFTGAGEVEGPGTGVSDSIPARLSDGEFVFTKKATDQLGADNLQTMMDDAERAYDGGEIRMPKEGGGMMMYRQRDEDPLAYEKVAQDEIKKSMLRANRAPSLLG